MTATAPEDPTAVVEVGLHRVGFDLLTPHVSAHDHEHRREVVLVEARLADGTVGWGECSALSAPTYTAEHLDGAWLVLRDHLVPAFLSDRRPRVVGHPMATAAVLTAISDALLRRVERSLATELAAVLGGNPSVAVPATAVVGRHATTEDLLATVARRLEAGAALVKLKVAEPADLDHVAAVRASWPEVPVAADLNGSGTDEVLRPLDRMGLAYLEQPAPADELVASARIAAELSTPVALDESIGSVGDLDVAVALGAGRIVNVKPARCGGPHRAAALVGRARNAGWDAFVGGMLESGVGRAAALAVAAAPGCS
ncbi:MAG: hypothetical protein KDA98_11145, partial [Acidimicrobiales bacterium]|nr:hypothetical protein [Acidimicrobiales bacterium]